MRSLPKAKDVPSFLMAIGLPLLALVAWIPQFMGLRAISADQVWENFAIGTACQAGRFKLGWLGESLPTSGMGSFTGSLPARLVSYMGCQLSLHSGLNPAQALLLLGLSLTFGLALWACRQAAFRWDTSLVVAFLMTTAPCSFSRIGHLSLAMLWPVIPGLTACHALWRVMQQRRGRAAGLGSGAAAGLLCFPAQDYYLVFLILQILVCFALLLFLATTRTRELRALGRMTAAGCLFVSGFVLVMILLECPNLVANAVAGPPSAWVLPRSPIEQFQYGLLPYTWWIPSPWHAFVYQSLADGGLPTAYESFWMSRGSLLIPIAWLTALWQLGAKRSQQQQLAWLRSPIPFFALLLGLVSFLGLFCMTMGGMGTLFAVVISPVLRSLNRYTVFVYGASVLLLVSLLDGLLRRRVS